MVGVDVRWALQTVDWVHAPHHYAEEQEQSDDEEDGEAKVLLVGVNRRHHLRMQVIIGNYLAKRVENEHGEDVVDVDDPDHVGPHHGDAQCIEGQEPYLELQYRIIGAKVPKRHLDWFDDEDYTLNSDKDVPQS